MVRMGSGGDGGDRLAHCPAQHVFEKASTEVHGEKEEHEPAKGRVHVARVEVVDAGLVNNGGNGADNGEGEEDDMDGTVQRRASDGEHHGHGEDDNEG